MTGSPAVNPGPVLSVIVPAYQAAGFLQDTLAALRASDPPGVAWELIVVDDGSIDQTAVVASRFAARVVRMAGPPGGPARARNAGAEHASGEWLLFVDADVRVRPGTLRAFWRSVESHPSVSAIFGTYDATPDAPGLVSRYRNLLHRRVHLGGAGPAETFWGGLGGVRTELFRRLGGFDTRRFPRPQIEDIELGYRLRDAGADILLDPSIEGTHLKRWRFGRMALTDFRDRALPWMRLLLEGRHRAASLNIAWGERLKVVVAGAALAALALAVAGSQPALAWLSLGLAAVLGLANLPVYRWFAREQGELFALAALPLHLWYYFSNAVAAGLAVLAHLARLAQRLLATALGSPVTGQASANRGILPEAPGSQEHKP